MSLPLNFSRCLLIGIGLLLTGLPVVAQPFQLQQTQLNLVVVTGINHLPQRVHLTPSGTGFSYASMTAASDAAWAVPSIDAAGGDLVLSFSTASLAAASSTATITVHNGADVRTMTVTATTSALNLYKLVDDPFRSRVYGTHQNGVDNGTVVVADPISGTSLGCLTVGKKPCGMAVSNDGTELFVINAADASISVINLSALAVTQTIVLPSYSNWGAADTTADIATGAGSILYYTDGSWAPALYVYDRSSAQVKQTVPGPGSNGFGDIGLTSDKKLLFGWLQYGWSAGYAGSAIYKYSVATDGTLTFVQQSNDAYPTGLSRDPLNTPVLISSGNDKVFIKQHVVDPASVTSTLQVLPSEVYSISPGGEVAATAGSIYNMANGAKVYDLPVNAPVQAITSDYARLVYFDSSQHAIGTVDLFAAVGADVLGITLSPANGAIVQSPLALTWSPLAGFNAYQVYLSSSASAAASANTASSAYLGQSALPQFTLTSLLTPGTTYYWRVDSLGAAGSAKGDVHSFTVSLLSSTLSKIDTATVQGHATHRVQTGIGSVSPGVSWTASADQPWISFTSNTGSTPGTLEVVMNTTTLAAGIHTGMVTLSGSSGTFFTLPVRLKVEPLTITVLKSDKASNIVYGISEDAATPGAVAYLLEMNSSTETISRVVPVGSSVTDLAVHNGDNRLYVPNWKTGSLLAINKATLLLDKSYAFTPFGGVGYSSNDVYRVSAGTAGRLVIENEDQWINIDIFNTVSGSTQATSFQREGGGAFDPAGHYYYHGDDNISDAAIHKLDVTGDVFTEVKQMAPTNGSGYGSRVVTVSENGNGVFWSGTYYDAALNVQWVMGHEIYSTTADARYAAGDTSIYDTVNKTAVLGMPVTTRVSSINSTTRKLVVQVGGAVKFYDLSSPFTLAAPQLSAGEVTSSSVALNWIDNSLETGFVLQYKGSGSATWVNASALPAQNDTSAIISSLAATTSYDFRIKATTATLSSAWSNTVTVQTPEVPPSTPYYLNANAYATSVQLSWPDSDVEDSFTVERAPGGTTQWNVIATVPAHTLTYLDTPVLPETAYVYRVKARRGTVDSGYTPLASVLTLKLMPPGAILGFGGKTRAGPAVSLVWRHAPDGSGYRLERKADAGWSLIATLAASATAYTDATVSLNTSYTYRLTAYNAAGDSAPAVSQAFQPFDFVTIMQDDFDPEKDALVWADDSGGTLGTGQGISGNAWIVQAAFSYSSSNQPSKTVALDVSRGGTVAFDAETSDYYFGAVTLYVDYSLDGVTWTPLGASALGSGGWTSFEMPVPSEARSVQTQFRWHVDASSNYSGMIDNVEVRIPRADVLAIEVPPKSVILNEGMPFTLTVFASGTGLSYQWLKDGKVMPGERAPSHEVSISTQADAGAYQCRVSDAHSSLLTAAAEVILIEHAGFPSPLVVNEGELFFIGVNVLPSYTLPGLSIQWSKDGVVAPFTVPLLGAYATAQDSGVYSCQVSYQTASVTAESFTVVVRTRPYIALQNDVTCPVSGLIDRWVQVRGDSPVIKVAGLPPGVLYDPVAKTVKGSPTKDGTYHVTVTAANAAGIADPRSFVITVTPMTAQLCGSALGVVGRHGAINAGFGGKVSLTVSSVGACTGTLALAGKSYSLAGNLVVASDGQSGDFTASIAQPKAAPLIVSLHLDAQAPLVGTVTHDSDSAAISGIFLRKNAKPLPTGAFNLAFTPSDSAIADPATPHGCSFAHVSILSSGVTAASGQLADGTAFTFSGLTDDLGQSPCFQTLNQGRGSIMGLVNFGISTASGATDWVRLADPKASTNRIYRGGFALHNLTVAGGGYARFGQGYMLSHLSALPSSAQLSFGDGGLSAAFTQSFVISSNSSISMPSSAAANPQKVSLTLSSVTGQFSGSFQISTTSPLLNRSATFAGLIVPGLGEGRGFLLLPQLPPQGGSPQQTPILSGTVSIQGAGK